MRTAFAYTSARILMFGISVIVLYFAGARGLLLLGLGLVVSALGSYVLLNKQRQIVAERLNSRLSGRLDRRMGLSRVAAKAAEFRQRLDEGAMAEDDELDDAPETAETRTPAATAKTEATEEEPAR
jgi:UPF0716 family protein affecting phage T7 exclusion